EWARAGAADARRAGTAAGARLYGMLGNDTALGGGGDDIVNTGEGGVFPGAQSLDGGAGNDKLYVSGTNFNDRITVWDPDGNNATSGSTLIATVDNPPHPVTASPVPNTAASRHPAHASPLATAHLPPPPTSHSGARHAP